MTNAERGRANRARGVNFERRIAKRFREAGFDCRRLWAEQFDTKCARDLELSVLIRPFTADHPQVRYIIPAALQLKCTQDENDLERGLAQVTKEPGYKLYACIHSCKRELRVMIGEPREQHLHLDVITWDQLLSKLRLLCPLKSWSPPSAS